MHRRHGTDPADERGTLGSSSVSDVGSAKALPSVLGAVRFARGGIRLAHRSEDPLSFCRADRWCKEPEVSPDDDRSNPAGRELCAGRAGASYLARRRPPRTVCGSSRLGSPGNGVMSVLLGWPFLNRTWQVPGIMLADLNHDRGLIAINVFVRNVFLRDLSIRDADDRHQWDLHPFTFDSLDVRTSGGD